MSVEAEGNNTITVTVEVTGYASECPNKASNTMIVEHVGLARKFDEYHDLKFNEERLRLDQLARRPERQSVRAQRVIRAARQAH